MPLEFVSLTTDTMSRNQLNQKLKLMVEALVYVINSKNVNHIIKLTGSIQVISRHTIKNVTM